MSRKKFDKRNSLDQLVVFMDSKGYRVDTAYNAIYKDGGDSYCFERHYKDKQDLVNFANSL